MTCARVHGRLMGLCPKPYVIFEQAFVYDCSLRLFIMTIATTARYDC